MLRLSHSTVCLNVVYEVPIPLSDLFERYFNIADGQKQLLNCASAYTRGVKMHKRAFVTSLLELAHSRAQCINSRIIALAAGERLRSKIGAKPRFFGESST